jgi:hypothetical protein
MKPELVGIPEKPQERSRNLEEGHFEQMNLTRQLCERALVSNCKVQ